MALTADEAVTVLGETMIKVGQALKDGKITAKEWFDIVSHAARRGLEEFAD